MIRHAFKEWAVICRALEEGRQAIILRKGGIAEEGGVFKPDHSRFWLFPTFAHQQRAGVKPEAAALLQAAEGSRPPTGMLRLSHFADVSGTFFVPRLVDALALDPLHLWSEEIIRQRFAYRSEGLYVLAVRVYRIPTPFDVPLKPEYDGCKTWVELDADLPTAGAEPVIDSRKYASILEEIDGLIHPTGVA